MQITVGELTLHWHILPAAWTNDGQTATLTAAGGTDIFHAPDRSVSRDDSARALAVAPEGDWQFSARVGVEFGDRWDAGTLLVWVDEQRWAKLCFELSPQRIPTVVSVVTRGHSDDAVGWPPAGRQLWLRVSHRDGAFYFHASEDGGFWRLARQFSLGDLGMVRVGIGVQSPVGGGCTAVFDRFSFAPTRLPDPFDGG